jgi:hypothetical protein
MMSPRWDDLCVGADIVRERTPDKNHLVLRVPRVTAGRVQQWERIGNVPGAEITTAQGFVSTPATVVKALQAAEEVHGL